MAYVDSICKQGYDQLEARNYAKAIELFTKALSIDGNHLHALSGRSQALQKQGRLAAAINDLSRYIVERPDEAEVFFQRGLLYSANQERDKALADFARAIELEPNLAEAFAARARLQEDPTLAIEDYSRAIAANPGRSEYYLSRAQLYSAQGAKEAALADLSTLRSLAPDNVEALLMEADILQAMDSLAGAIEALTRAVSLNKNHTEAKKKLTELKQALRQSNTAYSCDEVSSSWQSLKKSMSENLSLHAMIRHFLPAATEQQFEELEDAIELELPDDFKALWSIHNGEDKKSIGTIFGFRLMSCAEIKDLCLTWYEDFEEEEDDDDDESERYFSTPPGHIRREMYNPNWIPFAVAQGKQYLLVDLDPEKDGIYGQVISYSQHDNFRYVIAASLQQLLERVTEQFTNQNYVVTNRLTFKEVPNIAGFDRLSSLSGWASKKMKEGGFPKRETLPSSSGAGVKDAWSRIESWLEKNQKRMLKSLNSGATAGKISSLENRLSISLPEEFKDLWSIHDGQDEDCTTGVLYGLRLLSLDEIEDEWSLWASLAEDDETMTAYDPQNYWSHPEDHIRRQYINLKWIPITKDYGGNHIGIDLDPGPEGRIGQVINFGRDEGRKFVLARSLSHFMDLIIEQLEQGNFRINRAGDEFTFRKLTGVPGFEHMIYLTGSGSVASLGQGLAATYDIYKK